MATAPDYLQDQRTTSITYVREAHARFSGGDLVDVFPSTGKRETIVMADVRGLDARAAEDARYLRFAVRRLADLHLPGSLLACLNLVFHRRVADSAAGYAASLFLAVLHGRSLTYASAGHEFALLMHANGRHQRLPLSGRMLGMTAEQRHTQKTIAIAPGDWLVLVTRGITHARDAQGALFGVAGVERSTRSAIKAGVDDPAAWILDAARTHDRGESFDEGSVLCVRFASWDRDVDVGL
jgi:sigma-B regulation protein RsbU (phosphoserine phosphatase)